MQPQSELLKKLTIFFFSLCTHLVFPYPRNFLSYGFFVPISYNRHIMWSHSVPFSCVVSEKHVISTEQREILGKRQIQFSVLTVIDLFSCLINFNFVAIQHLTIFSPLPRCNDISRSLTFITQSLPLFGPTSLTIKAKCQTVCNRWQGYF